MAQQQAAVCTQLHPPSAVTHCVAAWLTRAATERRHGATGSGSGGARLPNLAVVRSTQLELYTVRGTRARAAGGARSADGSSSQPVAWATASAGLSLELVSSCQLFGVVESVAVLHARAPGQRDALLLTFRDAKLSVLHWDSAAHTLAPSSLHYFEGDASLKAGRTQFPFPPLAATDPQGRCAAVLMFRHQLAVLPAVDSELLALGIAGEEEEEETAALLGLLPTPPPAPGGPGASAGAAQGGTNGAAAGSAAAAGPLAASAAAVGNSYVDNLGKAGIKEVRHAVFLHGYNEPVLALLHEGEPTWGGNLRQKKDSCLLTGLSLNLTRKHHPKIWGASQLPSDAQRLSAAPCGGVLVLCQHLVLYYRQGQQTGVVLHPSVLPPAVPPPPLVFDARVMQEAGGPGPAAAQYAQKHAMDVHPETVPAAVQFCDASQAAELKATADGASVCWLSPDSALLCLRSGQLLQLSVQPQPGGGGARRLTVARAGAAPQPSCCCSLAGVDNAPDAVAVLQPALVFFGSLAGDSLLVRATPVLPSSAATGSKRPADAAGAARQGDGGGKPASKRLRLEGIEAAVGAEAGGVDSRQHGNQQQQQQRDGSAAAGVGAQVAGSDSEDEEALIYGTALTAAGTDTAAAGAAAAAPQLQRYQLKVLDSLANIGPVRDFAIAEAPGGEAPPYVVACSGEGKGGMLTVLRRSVVPDVITEVPLPGLLGAWAVHHRRGDPAVPPEEEQFHAYLLLSFQGATKVLATGEELREVTEMVEFAVDTPTVAAGTLCGGRRIVQVFPQGLRLLDGEESVQDIWASELVPDASGGNPAGIVAADVADPYVIVLLADGTAALFAADPSSCRLQRLCGGGGDDATDAAAAAATAAALRPAAAQDRLTACSLFSDTCGWLQAQGLVPPETAKEQDSSGSLGGMYCLLCRASGACQLFSLPAWQPVFSSSGFADGLSLLAGGQAAPSATNGEVPEVVEARLVSFGPVAASRTDAAAARASAAPACEAPVLLALTADHQLLAYQAFNSGSNSSSSKAKSRSRLRFRRLALDLPPLLPPAGGEQQLQAAWRLQRLHWFEGLGEESPCSGIFVAGQHPHWLVASRGALQPHPHHLPPAAAAAGAAGFTPFHNINCPFGFIVATGGAQSGIQISQPPPRTRLDAPWTRQRVAIKGTPLRVAHYAEADLFAVLTCRQVPFKPFLPEEDEPGEPQASYSYALAEAAARSRGTMQGHEVRLVWPGGGWQGLWWHQLLAGERALSVAAVRLKDQSTGATVPLLAVGAALPAGEDYPCGGRLLLFEVVKADGGLRAGQAGQWSGRLIYTREFKGPVTALSGLEGYLLLASGNRIETCSLSSTTLTSTADDGTVSATTTWKLQRSAFYDGPMLLTSLNVVKNFVLLGDVQHSVQFVRYKDEGRQLSLLSKDFNRADVASTQFLINGSSLHLASGDSAGTLRLLSYAPAHPESWKGQRLVAWGSFHIGDAASAMQRLRLHPAGPEDHTTRQAVLLSTPGGSLQLLAPLALPAAAGLEMTPAVAALRALQRELLLLLPQAAGLNPAAFRRRYAAMPPGLQGGRCFSKQLALEGQGILDGDLLRQYLQLPRQQQEGTAEAAGLDRQQLLELLQGLWRSSGTLL